MVTRLGEKIKREHRKHICTYINYFRFYVFKLSILLGIFIFSRIYFRSVLRNHLNIDAKSVGLRRQKLHHAFHNQFFNFSRKKQVFHRLSIRPTSNLCAFCPANRQILPISRTSASRLYPRSLCLFLCHSLNRFIL